MPLNFEAKQSVVAEVNAVAATAPSAVAAEYRGLTVGQMTQLRSVARNADVYLKVVKNTLARRAVAGTDFECMQDRFSGPLLLAFSREDPGAAARVIRGFAKDHEKLVAVAVVLGGQLYEGSDLERVASLPTLDEARAQLLGTFLAPLGQFVRVLAEPGAQLARVLNAHAEQAGESSS